MLKGNILFNSTAWVFDFYNNTMSPLWGHKYHILPTSSSPIAISFALLSFLLILVFDFHGSKVTLTSFDSFISFLINFFDWKIFNQSAIYNFIYTDYKITKILVNDYSFYNHIHFFWIAPFFLTLGCFFVWSSNAIDEGTSFKINFSTFLYKSFFLSSKPNIEPMFHTNLVWKGFKIGFILFIVSEVMFFFGFFWGFFHSSISPTIQIGAVWPPLDVEFITVKGFAVANTVILLTSGATLTIAHYGLELIPQKKNKLFINDHGFTDSAEAFQGKLEEIYLYINKKIFKSAEPEIYQVTRFSKRLENWNWIPLPMELTTIVIPFQILFNPFNKYFQRNFGLKETETIARIYINLMLNATLILAILFMIFQGTEYFISPVSINSGVYGSTFYMITGLHGAHVFIGTCFLFYCRLAVTNWWNLKNIFIYLDIKFSKKNVDNEDIKIFLEDFVPTAAKHFIPLFILDASLPWALWKAIFNPFRALPLTKEQQEKQDLINLSKTAILYEQTTPINNYGKYGIESFESAAWYWHFVDVVWIFVFGFVYIWSHLTVLDLQ